MSEAVENLFEDERWGALFDWLQNLTGFTLPDNVATGQDAPREDNAPPGMSGLGALARLQATNVATPPPSPSLQLQAGLTDTRPGPAVSDRQSGGTEIESAQPSGPESAGLPAPASTRWQTMRPYVIKMLPYGPVVLDGLAAGLSGATSNLSAYPAVGARVTGALSGGLWFASAAGLQYFTPCNDYMGTAGNVLGGTAGVLALADALVHSNDTADVGYGSAGAWVAGGLAGILHAVSLIRSGAAPDSGALANRLANTGALASGMANAGAAIFSAVASDMTAHGQTAISEISGTTSATLWFTGTVGLGLTVWAAYSAGLGNTGTPGLTDLEAGPAPTELSGRNPGTGDPGTPPSPVSEANADAGRTSGAQSSRDD